MHIEIEGVFFSSHCDISIVHYLCSQPQWLWCINNSLPQQYNKKHMQDIWLRKFCTSLYFRMQNQLLMYFQLNAMHYGRDILTHIFHLNPMPSVAKLEFLLSVFFSHAEQLVLNAIAILLFALSLSNGDIFCNVETFCFIKKWRSEWSISFGGRLHGETKNKKNLMQEKIDREKKFCRKNMFWKKSVATKIF